MARKKHASPKKKQHAVTKHALNKKNGIILFILLGITFLAFLPSLQAEFNNWDDDLYVVDNPYLFSFSIENIKNIFTNPISGNYNPLTIFTFAIERHFFGLNPFPYHLNNVLLHLFCTGLVFWLVRLLKLPFIGAIVVTALFGLHPMRVESVAWVTERKDVLFGVFYIGAMISYLYYLDKPKGKNKYLILAIFLMFGSCLSKIQAVSLPLSLLAIDYYKKRAFSLSLLVDKIPFFALSLATGLIGIHFLDASGTLETGGKFEFYERLLFAPYAICTYLYKIFIPYPLSAYYPYPVKTDGLLPIIYYITPFILLLLGGGMLWSMRKTRVIAFGFAFFLVNIMFLLQVVGAGEAYLVDRFTYIPYIGLFFILGYGIQKLIKEKRVWKNVIIGAATVWMLFLAFLSFQQSKVWKNNFTLWSNVIEKFPKQVPVSYNNRGTYYRDNGKPALALADFNTAISLNETYHLPYINRGNIFFSQNKLTEALADYKKVAKLKPKNAKAYGNMGAIYFRQSQHELAIENLNKALQLQTFYPDALINRAVVWSVLNKHQEALKDYNTYLSYFPNHKKAIGWRGISRQKTGQHQLAIQDFTKAIKLKASLKENYKNRAASYAAIGNKSLALQDAQKAQQLGATIDANFLQSLQ